MKRAPIHWWREPVDAEHFALVTFCEFTSYGLWHVASFFVVLPMERYHDWHLGDVAEGTFAKQLDVHHGGTVPMVYEPDNWRRTH